MKKSTKAAIAAASVTGAVTAGVIYFSNKVARKFINHPQNEELDLDGLKVVHIQNGKGQQLTGYLSDHKKDTAMILIHPSTNSGLDMVSYYHYFQEHLDINYLMIDLSGYGNSDGEHIAFDGSYEKDLLDWIDYLKKDGVKKVVLYGKQLGANVILNDLRRLQKLNMVACVIVDGATVSNEKMIEEQVNSFFPAIRRLISFVSKLIMKYRYHIPFAKQEILENLKNYPDPILFIQAKNDPLVRFKQVFGLFNAKQDNKELICIKDQAYLYQSKEDDPYCSVLLEFIQNTLK